MIIDFVVPGSIHQLTGGYIYDKWIIEELGRLSYQVHLHELSGSFPFVSSVAKKEASRIWKESLGLIIADGLALPAFYSSLKNDNFGQAKIIALVHHPLALETGLTLEESDILKKEESAALGKVDRIIVTSPNTAQELLQYKLPFPKIGVVNPGVVKLGARSFSEPPPKKSKTIELLCVASLVPRKGHLLLVEALAELKDLNWKLICVGNLTRDPLYAQKIQNSILKHQLEKRICLVGEKKFSELNQCYEEADVFVLASHYEGYGMVLSEAMVAGLPIVATTGGAIKDTVPKEAGVLVPPGNSQELAQVLRRIICDQKLREQLREGARQAGKALSTWSEAGKLFAEEIEFLF